MSKFKPNEKATTVVRERPSAAAVLDRVRSMGIGTSVISGPTAAIDAASLDANALKGSEFRHAALNTTRKFALSCTLAFLFFRFSFLHEFLSAKYYIDVHILMVLGGLSFLACLLSGTLFSGLKYKAVSMWVLFALCMCMATVTSSWRGGSVNVVLPYLRTTLILIFLIPGVAYTTRDIQKVVDTIGFAGMTTILIGLISNDFRAGRLELTAAGGSIQNANDFAAEMLLVLPAVAYCTLRQGRSAFMKLIGIGFIAAGFYELLSTGSRGGLVAVVVTALYILKKGSNKLRAGLMLGIPILCAFVIPFIPGEAADRLASLVDSRDQTEEAVESKSARTALLEASLKITFFHPLLGIGPGEFQDYQANIAAQSGERGMWHETHNGYTQISSECGVPAIAFFVAGMVIAFRSLRRAANAKVAPLSSIAHTLSVMMIGFSVCLCFLSQGYSFGLLVIGGLSACIERLLANQHSATDQRSSTA